MEEKIKPEENVLEKHTETDGYENAVIGGGCFWCLEAIFVRIEGVAMVESGYAGGSIKDPTYAQVCAGETGHAEVISITYDPQTVSYRTLLEVFFYVHDPTTLNRQGNDIGEHYRSIILYNSPQQEETAKDLIEELEGQNIFDDPIVTELKELELFYKAEDYHQNYYENNPNRGYCQAVIDPKLEKFKQQFDALVK